MVGRQAKGQQVKMFFKGFSLEQRVRPDHPLRKVKKLIDFDFTYEAVAKTYGIKGNVSIPPPVILKLMLLLIFYNVRSERELMATMPERNDWLWFIGYDLDDQIPDHSVLSKARSRWGNEAFKDFFERIVCRCVEAGLVDGSKIFMDSSLIQADASKSSIINMNSLKSRLNRHYKELETRLDDESRESGGGLNGTHLSTTDPDASIVSKGKVRSQLSYKVHRAVDEQSEVITATAATTGAVNEGHLLNDLIDQHTENTHSEVEVVVADSQYGTVKNYLECLDRGIKAHIPPLREGNKGLFSEEDFRYDPQDDTYVCPCGNRLKCQSFNKEKQVFQYKCRKKICQVCPMRDRCTTSKEGRTLKRHLRHDEARSMREKALSPGSIRDIRTRRHLMERSFARAVPFGFKRARWRRLWKVQIQEYLTAAIQNIMVLVRNVKEPRSAMANAMRGPSSEGPHREQGFRTLVTLMSHFCAFLAGILTYTRHPRQIANRA